VNENRGFESDEIIIRFQETPNIGTLGFVRGTSEMKSCPVPINTASAKPCPLQEQQNKRALDKGDYHAIALEDKVFLESRNPKRAEKRPHCE